MRGGRNENVKWTDSGCVGLSNEGETSEVKIGESPP